MSLYPYRRPRSLVLNSRNTVLEAARAIEKNRVGAVVVQDAGQVVGILTDRDLAVRVVGRALDPETTKISEVMSKTPMTLSPEDDVEDAIQLMQERNVRRVPLVEGKWVVGMVTLDDLLLNEAAPLEELAAIVEGQIGEGGLPESPRTPAQRRRLARAEATLGRLVAQVRSATELDDAIQSRMALEVVLGALVRRVTADEAKDLIAQLPSLLQKRLRALPPGPDKSITRATVEAEMAEQLGVSPQRASELVAAVAGTIAANITPGQLGDMRVQLPEDLRVLLEAPTEEAETA